MGNEIETSKAFQERVFEKIRQDIGNLMTEAELKSLVNAAMNKAFFEPTISKDPHGYYRDKEGPSFFVCKVKELMYQKVGAAIEQWISEHPEEVNKAIRDVLSGGIAGAVAMYLESRFSGPLQNLRSELEQKGLVEKKY